jgi:4-hydroxy-tetrahydrodipicolinate reductase
MIRVVVAGVTGWVGRALVPAIAAAEGLALAGAVSRSAAGRDVGEALGLAPMGVPIAATLEEALKSRSDVVVDYTKPGAVMAHAMKAIAAGRHVVIGTSGLGAEDYAEIDDAARMKSVGIIAAGNFSITAALLKRFALEAAKYVPDVEIVDYASAKKPDTPSGTARELAEVLSFARQAPTSRPVDELAGIHESRGAAIGLATPVQVHSLRLPGFILSCEALFGLADERLVIRHDAGASAAPYVAGTLLAVRHVSEQAGLRRGLDSLMDQ